MPPLPPVPSAPRAAQAFFLPAGPGQRLCLHHAPAAGPALRGAVLYLHPLAEEMNKSRRMAALQARALAEAGFAVLQIDLHGCGDSSGDFGDARWDDWLDDAARGVAWLQARHPGAPLWLWGLRGGCLLAAQAAARAAWRCNFLFWQPAPSGKALLQQFLRLRLAADLNASPAKGLMDTLKQALQRGEAVDVAGYRLGAGLASGLEQAVLGPPPATGEAGGRVVWLEVSTREDASLLPASAAPIAAWQAAGWQVQARALRGPAFWQTQEIEDAPALLDASLDALAEAVAA